MKKLIAVIIIFLLISDSYAQTKSDTAIVKKCISWYSGYSQVKDENIHPKVFHGFTNQFSFTHSKLKSNLSEYDLGLKISLLSTVHEDFPGAAMVLIPVNYRYLFATIHTEKLSYYMGPIFNSLFGTSAYLNWDESHLYYANYISGGMGNRLIFKFPNNLLKVNIEIPLVSFIARPENNRQFKIDDMTFSGILKNLTSNPELVLPNKNFFITIGSDWQYHTKKQKTRSLGYFFMYHYMKSSNGNPYQYIQHAITYKIIY